MITVTNRLRRLSLRVPSQDICANPSCPTIESKMRLPDSPSKPGLQVILADEKIGLPGRAESVSDNTISGQLMMHMIPSNTTMAIPTGARVSLVQTIKVKQYRGIVKGITLPKYKANGKPGLQRVSGQEDVVIASAELTGWKAASQAPSDPSNANNALQTSVNFELKIPEDLPATTETSLGRISYSILATPLPESRPDLEGSTQICIERAIPRSCTDREVALVREYPDTGLISTLIGPAYVEAVGTFPFQLQLDRTVLRGEQLTSFFRVNELSWRVDETVQILSISDEEFRQKGPLARKNVLQSVTRRLNGGKSSKWIHGGCDRSKLVFDVVVPRGAKAACGTDPHAQPALGSHKAEDSCSSQEARRLEMTVSHKLVVELTGQLEVFAIGTGKREDSMPRRRRVCGAAYDLRIANRHPDEEAAPFETVNN